MTIIILVHKNCELQIILRYIQKEAMKYRAILIERD